MIDKKRWENLGAIAARDSNAEGYPRNRPTQGRVEIFLTSYYEDLLTPMTDADFANAIGACAKGFFSESRKFGVDFGQQSNQNETKEVPDEAKRSRRESMG